jgi:hypothetical protein
MSPISAGSFGDVAPGVTKGTPARWKIGPAMFDRIGIGEAEGDMHAVIADQPAGDARDRRGVGLGVVDDELDRAAEHAAGGVDLADLEPGAVQGRAIERGERTRDIERCADLDRVSRTARLGTQSDGNRDGYGGQESSHSSLPFCFCAGVQSSAIATYKKRFGFRVSFVPSPSSSGRPDADLPGDGGRYGYGDGGRGSRKNRVDIMVDQTTEHAAAFSREDRHLKATRQSRPSARMGTAIRRELNRVV